MKGGTLNNDQRSKEYYRLAYKCIELSQTKKGCDHQCARCTLNIHLYMDNARDATLIKTSAGIDYQRRVAINKMWNAKATTDFLAPLFAFIFIIAIIVLPITCAVRKFTKPTYPTYEAQPETIAPDVWDKISVISKVTAYLSTDIDKDGSVNCIDRALKFYELWGSDCRIIWAIDPTDTYSHLFVAVPNGYGKYVYIDSTRTGPLDYMLMQNVFDWFNRVDKHDVTSYYSRIKNNTMRWVLPLP